MTNYFIFAGETSGDLHGSRLIQSLQEGHFSGIGGPHMRKENFDCLIKMENFQVMGLTDVLKSFPRLWKLFYQVRDLICQRKPDCLILIDYPGFNLRLAKSLRKKGYQGKIVQYICPSVWAHGKKRIATLAKHDDLLLTIYPFEKPYFSHTQLQVEYIGNPLVETIKTHIDNPNWKKEFGLPSDGEIISLFPGSRKGEILLHAPLQLQTAALLKRRYPQLIFAISCAQESLHEDLVKIAKQSSLKLNEDLFIVPSSVRYELMKSSKASLAKSGTVSLELALHAIPSVIHYELTPLNYFFAKYILRLQLSHYCIVNILAGKTLYPEFMGRQISPKDLSSHIEKLLFDSQNRDEVISGCQKISQELQNDFSAAKAIQRMLQC